MAEYLIFPSFVENFVILMKLDFSLCPSLLYSKADINFLSLRFSRYPFLINIQIQWNWAYF